MKQSKNKEKTSEFSNKLGLRTVWIEDLNDDDHVYEVIRKIATFDIEDNQRPICIFIHSDGGFIENMSKIQTLLLQNIESPLITIGFIEVFSSACALMPCGHLRVALNWTIFGFHRIREIIHEPKAFTKTDHQKGFKELNKIDKLFFKQIIMSRPEQPNPCKLSPKELMDKTDKSKAGDYIISAKQAKKLGFVDVLIKHPSELRAIEQKLMKTFSKKRKK